MVMKPRVHLNGTSAKDLAEGYQSALDALRTAEDALAHASPNARDYYPLGPGAFDVADDEHRARRVALVRVRQEIEELLMHVARGK